MCTDHQRWCIPSKFISNNNNNNNNNNEFITAYLLGGSSSAFVPIEFEVLVFVEGGKAENLEKNPRSRERTNNKLNPHETTSTGIEAGSQRWEACAYPLRHPCMIRAQIVKCDLYRHLSSSSPRALMLKSSFD